jgi:pyruvate dehydrogenase E2 component (dihydrolipoamide acetyltransferase)
LARRIARDRGLDISSLAGSGPKGRIVASDVEAALGKPTAAAVRTSEPAHMVAPTNVERVMAETVSSSKRDIPHFYLSTDIEVTALMQARAKLNSFANCPKITLTHLLVAAIVQALREAPAMHRCWSGEGIRVFDTVDIGLAIDTDRGLVNPVVRDLGNDHFYAQAAKIDGLIARARSSALRPDDFGGGSITLSNAGMHRLTYMTSIIVPGQSAILGIGAIRQVFRPDQDGKPALRNELGATLSADHRIHTGVGALTFLQAFESALTEPLLLLTSH